MAGLAPRPRRPEPRRDPPVRVAGSGRAAPAGRVPSCAGRAADPRRAAGPRPVPGPRPDRRLTTARPTAHPSSTGSATGSVLDPPTLLRRPLADTSGKDARDRWKMLLPHAPGGRSHEMARRRLFWGVCVGRVVLLWRFGAGSCPNLLQRRPGSGSTVRRGAEYQRFSSCAPGRGGPLQQIRPARRARAGRAGRPPVGRRPRRTPRRPRRPCRTRGSRGSRGAHRSAAPARHHAEPDPPGHRLRREGPNDDGG